MHVVLIYQTKKLSNTDELSHSAFLRQIDNGKESIRNKEAQRLNCHTQIFQINLKSQHIRIVFDSQASECKRMWKMKVMLD